MVAAADIWRAGKWQRAQSASLAAWRASDHSLARSHLVTLCDAISATAMSQSGSLGELANKLADVRSRCNELEFDSPDQVTAYMLLYLADRYGRVTQVLERLFDAGHLPIRRQRLSVLEIGAGPAPSLYAVNDFYEDLVLWGTATDQRVDFIPVTQLHALDKGEAWGHILHRLSETLLYMRRHPQRAGHAFPFHTRYADLAGFSIRKEHRNALECSARVIVDDFGDDDPISLPFALQLAQQDGVDAPSAYDIVVACYFLTTPEITQRFQEEIRDIARWLTPGGLLIFLGGTGGHYVEIWANLRSLLRSTGLISLSRFDEPIKANEDSRRAEVIRRQFIGGVEQIRRDGGQLPKELESLKPNQPFRPFHVMTWKNQRPARRK